MSAANEIDARARTCRERLLLAEARGDAAMALEALRDAVTLRSAGYELLWLVPGLAAAMSPPTYGRPFAARFQSRCIICDQAIGAGQLARMRDSDRAIAHQACAGGAR